jgi:hypothetical protein
MKNSYPDAENSSAVAYHKGTQGNIKGRRILAGGKPGSMLAAAQEQASMNQDKDVQAARAAGEKGNKVMP